MSAIVRVQCSPSNSVTLRSKANERQFFARTYIIDVYSVHSASGTAVSTLFRPVLGGLVPLFLNELYKQLDAGWTFSLLAGIALFFVSVP